MKKLQLRTLLIVLCAITLPITAQTNDSLKIAPPQVENVYKGLKQNEQLKAKLSDCLDIANSLNDIIQQQNDTIQSSVIRIIDLNGKIKKANDDYTKKSVELQKAKDSSVPWWKAGSYGVVIGFLLKLIVFR